MYAIATVVYGTYMTQEAWDVVTNLPRPDLPNGYEDIEDLGGIGMYGGGSDVSPGFFGVELDEFDEACSAVDVSKLKVTPTDTQKVEAWEIYNKLPKELQTTLPKMGVYFVWSSS